MRTIDNNGLVLCDLQSELFEKSSSLDCSSEIFIRRFMNSKVAKQFDSTQVLDDTLTIDNIFEELVNEYGYTSYGSVKYSRSELYWIVIYIDILVIRMICHQSKFIKLLSQKS